MFPLAICNEMFPEGDILPHAQELLAMGYSAVEIAPFTLACYPELPSGDQLRDLRRRLEESGLRVLGLHWLLAKTDLHAASPDPDTRARTVRYLGDLAAMCAELGGDVMVFGSPAQRSTPAGHNRADTLELFTDTLARAAELAGRQGVTITLEPLAPAETDIVNTAEEALAVIERVGSRWLRLHLDCKAMQAESEPREAVIRRFGKWLRSFHANDPNRLGPGMGDLDFRPVLEALEEVGYQGYLSVEVFDFSPGPLEIARKSAEYLRSLMRR